MFNMKGKQFFIQKGYDFTGRHQCITLHQRHFFSFQQLQKRLQMALTQMWSYLDCSSYPISFTSPQQQGMTSQQIKLEFPTEFNQLDQLLLVFLFFEVSSTFRNIFFYRNINVYHIVLHYRKTLTVGSRRTDRRQHIL